MQLSRDRILTTHVGSLPRPQDVVAMLFAQDRDEAYDAGDFAATMQRAVADAMAKQRHAGIDVVSDGEMSKISYATYIRHRLTGFTVGDVARSIPQDLDAFPEYRDRLSRQADAPRYRLPKCTGPIAVKDLAPLRTDIEHLTQALAGSGATEGFMNAASPGVIAVFQPNEYYPSHSAYLAALADAMRPEYGAIVSAGLILQVDCPDLAMGRHIKFRDATDADFIRAAHQQVEALNSALSAVPADRVRMHVCWGNYEGPHTFDIPLRKIIDIVLKAKPQAILFEAANPRHAHEWTVWRDVAIPGDKVLIPGCIDSTTNYVEHPELVAERLQRFAAIVGRERVLAGADCGFGTFAGTGRVHPSVAYAKLAALAEGAATASGRLW
jgi:5-methyltetrahydropteroyltriglutamate--homocysteine methyltransferase